MLSAFQAHAIHELKPRDKTRIESLLAYGDRLLVGLNTGSLRVYRVNETQPPPASHDVAEDPSTENGEQQTTPKTKAVELLREEEKFSKKPVQQLAIVKEANLLVSLSDGYISLHDLQTWSLVERFERTKGATCFAVTSNVIKDPESSIPSLVSRLAVGVKRKILCWTWSDMELSDDVIETSLESVVKSATWATETKIVVGMDAGFSILDIQSEEIVSVNKPASRNAPGAKEDVAAGELAGVRFAAVSSSGMGYMGMGSWVPKPMCARLRDNELLLAKDVNTLFTDASGKPLERRQVPWSLAPEAVGYSYPYLLGLQSPERGALQIRNPETLTLLQNISVPQAMILHVPQPNISLAHAGKGFLVASERTIWRMNALPYPSQVEELVENGRYDEAISLLELLEDTLIDDKTGRIREVRVKKAESLFKIRKYRPALDLFSDAQAEVERVVKLYPRSIAGKLSSISDSTDQSDDLAEDSNADRKPEDEHKEAPTTPSKSMLSRFKASQKPPQTPSPKPIDSDTASIRSVTRTDTDNMSIRTSRTPTRATGLQDKPLEGEDLKLAVRALCSFLAQARVQVQKHLNTDGTLKDSPPTLDPESQKPAFANLLPSALFHGSGPWNMDYQIELVKVAQLVDTTLFRSYMLALPSLAGPLFRLDNFCEPDVVQAALYENERYGDLIDFLHGKKLHRQALELLQKFGKGEVEEDIEVPEGMSGPGRTVAYLKYLPPELIELMLEFVLWPIDVDAELGLSVFTVDSDNAEHLDRRRVVAFLKEANASLERKYLEHIIEEWNDLEPDFHQRLVEMYIQALQDPVMEDEQKVVVKSKLETFLRTSKRYNRGQTFRLLDPEASVFYESRATVLMEMGNYKQALAIYVFKMGDFEKAEEHCSRIYLREQAERQEKENAAVSEAGGHGVHERTFPLQHESWREEDDESRNNVFAMLLGLYLRPPPGEEKRWPQALALLSEHGARLPASSTLGLMPDDLAVQELQDYFRGRIRHSTALLREERIVKGLEEVRRVRTEGLLLLGKEPDGRSDGRPQGRNRRAVVREEDHCKVCHKRFGASAVRVWPDGSVTHYGCVPGKGESRRAW